MGNSTTHLHTFYWYHGNEGQIFLETIKNNFFLLLLLSIVSSQQYTISILGLTASDVFLETSYDSIEFNTQSRGLVDAIWPTKNNYTAKFNPDDFSMISWRKNISQGGYKKSLFGKIDSSDLMLYDSKNKIKLQKKTQNIFTMLAMVQKRDREYLDTKWFHYENAGSLGKARFIWADSSNAWDGQDSILCDHYRFDIEILDSTKHIKTTDYFLNNINESDLVRELWVSKSNPKKIILARINNGFLTVTARIKVDPKL